MEQFIESFLTYFFSHKLELFAALTGLICVWLNTRNNHWGWFFGILSVVPYIYIFFEAGLIGDSFLSLFYFIVSIWGWYNWLFGGKNKKQNNSTLHIESSILDNKLQDNKTENAELPISTMTPYFLQLSLIIGTLSTAIWGTVLYFVSENLMIVSYLDAFTTSFSIIAQFQLAKRWVENWIFWFVIDVVCVGLYYYKGLYFTTGLYAVFLVLAVLGYFEWKKKMTE